MGTMPPVTAVPGLRTTPSVVLASIVPGSTSDVPTSSTITASLSSSSILPSTSITDRTVAAPTLPTLPAVGHTPSSTLTQAGMFMGDGMVPLPTKIVTKILALEYVEMQELLPENWSDLHTEDQSKFYSLFGKKKSPPVTNILTWIECFSALVSVLSTKYPMFVPELMAYMCLIVKCHKRFEGLGWFNYDRAYRRQAATLRSLNWSKTDSTLFSLAFTGKAKKSASCELCFSSNHPTHLCQESQAAVTLTLGGPVLPTSALQASQQQQKQRPICGLYNTKKGCYYGVKCKYSHVCQSCKGYHPRYDCTAMNQAKRPRPLM